GTGSSELLAAPCFAVMLIGVRSRGAAARPPSTPHLASLPVEMHEWRRRGPRRSGARPPRPQHASASVSIYAHVAPRDRVTPNYREMPYREGGGSPLSRRYSERVEETRDR